MSYKFISKQTTFPSFFQYPKFLLKLPISQTGKITYMLLYDRARLSQKNNWMDEKGRIFVIFPVKELAKKLEKSETTVKTALNELDEAGLLQRRSGGFSKPNHIFLKILTEVENSELGENQSVGGSDNCLPYGKKCDCDKTSSSAPIKVIEKSNYSQNNGMTTRAWTMRDRNVGKHKCVDEIDYNCEEGDSL